MTRLLIIDDVDVAGDMAPYLAKHGFEVEQIYEAVGAVAEVEERAPDLVLLDLHFPGDNVYDTITSGGQLHTALRQRFPHLPIFIFSSRPDDNNIPRENFEIEPHASTRKPDLATVDWAVYAKRLRHLMTRFEAKLAADWLTTFGFFVGQSEAMLAFAQAASRAAASSLNILLVGEAGTGKELAARAIHAASGSVGHFVPVRLARFTADQVGPDWMAEARGGTLYLDGLDDLAIEASAALLAWIDDVESTANAKPRTRLIASCTDDQAAIERLGQFNRRLQGRLAQVKLQLEPLRERPSDIPALFARCVELFNDTAELPISTLLRPETEALLRSHDWPGNIREFNRVLDYAIAFTGNEILMPVDIMLPARHQAAQQLAVSDQDAAAEPAQTPAALSAEQMADYHFETMHALPDGERYHCFMRLDPAMQVPVARRIKQHLGGLGRALQQRDYSCYFHGAKTTTTKQHDAVRRYFTAYNIWKQITE